MTCRHAVALALVALVAGSASWPGTAFPDDVTVKVITPDTPPAGTQPDKTSAGQPGRPVPPPQTGAPGSFNDPDPFGRPSILAPLAGDGAIDQALRRVSLTAEQKAKLAPIVEAAAAQRKADWKEFVDADRPATRKLVEARNRLDAEHVPMKEWRNDAGFKAAVADREKLAKSREELGARRRHEVAEKIVAALTPEQAKLFGEWETETAQTAQGQAWRTAVTLMFRFAPKELNLSADQQRRILELLRRRMEESGAKNQRDYDRMNALTERVGDNKDDAAARAELEQLRRKSSAAYAAEMKAICQDVEMLMTPEQQKQCREIRKERASTTARMWIDPLSARYQKLGLTAEQKQKIDALVAAARDAMVGAEFGDLESRDLVEQLNNDVVQLLTDQQKATLKKG
ncbi:MAG: hypothetical protein PHU85_05500 [Phycisphaerae bacterium]|nr:hypothetical protein [Phycisphaerae bacterium]